MCDKQWWQWALDVAKIVIPASVGAWIFVRRLTKDVIKSD